MFFIVPTPIGNLGDWTYRAVETVKMCDIVLAEDTRTTQVLLNHYEIKKRLKSFHKFNERKQEDGLIRELKEGKRVALLSDAGTPLIQDPGAHLVKRCHQEQIPVTALPGPSAPITALSLAGGSQPFQFLGFLPKKEGARKALLIEALLYKGTTLFFETPHQLQKSLSELAKLSPHARVAVARELTKKFEELIFGPATDVAAHYQAHPPKGEMVLLIEGLAPLPVDMPPLDLVKWLETELSISQKEALKLAADLLLKSKKDLYRLTHT